MTDSKIDHEELRHPADPGAKDQPAEGGREEIEEDIRLAEERDEAPEKSETTKRT
jgi:hypothetical protein